MPVLGESSCEVLGLWNVAHIKRMLYKNLTDELGFSFRAKGAGMRFDTRMGKTR